MYANFVGCCFQLKLGMKGVILSTKSVLLACNIVFLNKVTTVVKSSRKGKE
jgi:hypothetical protein